MTFDSYNVETDPFLIEMRQQINELEKRKDELYKAANSDPDNVKAKLHYDIMTIKWARATNAYHDALRAALAL
jgi:hypothetical protein